MKNLVAQKELRKLKEEIEELRKEREREQQKIIVRSKVRKVGKRRIYEDSEEEERKKKKMESCKIVLKRTGFRRARMAAEKL